jgi:AcrR family transcriptional regulator
MTRTQLGDVFGGVEGPRPRPGRKGEAEGAETSQIQHTRMISAVLHVVAEKGYPATTVTDIVTRAKVSRMTFYSQFDSKEDCFIAAYDAVQSATASGINRAVGAGTDPVSRIVAGVDAYLAGIFSSPALSRVFYVDIYAAGPRALAMRRRATDLWAANIRRSLDSARRRCEPLAAMTQPMSQDAAVAAVVGINELVVRAIDDGATTASEELRATCLQVITGAAGDSAAEVARLLMSIDAADVERRHEEKEREATATLSG